MPSFKTHENLKEKITTHINNLVSNLVESTKVYSKENFSKLILMSERFFLAKVLVLLE